MANTLAYYNMTTITPVKSFIVQAPEVSFMLLESSVMLLENVYRPGACTIKLITAVIYVFS